MEEKTGKEGTNGFGSDGIYNLAAKQLGTEEASSLLRELSGKERERLTRIWLYDNLMTVFTNVLPQNMRAHLTSRGGKLFLLFCFRLCRGNASICILIFIR